MAQSKMSWLKRILATQYIGAIIVAFLWTQAILVLVQVVLNPLETLIATWLSQSNYRETFMPAPGSREPWQFELISLANAVVLALGGWLIARWLYSGEGGAQPEPVEEPQ